MKNLKKVLALGLALVMILGMFTIASAAETKKTAQEYPDWASVENKGAVSLMVDLGVINGMGDGTLSPANNIDRASWAKMVFFVLTGETDAKVYESDYPALKDIEKNWAQGYIEYLYSIECVSGDTDGNYNPGNPISVVAAAKTMLTGLGYNSKIEGYENDANWATNIMTRAKSIGLLNGISLKQNDNITRDAAAQMVYNALSAKTQTAKYTLNFMTGERVPSGEYTEGETLGEKAFDIRKFDFAVNDVDKSGNAIFTNGPKGDVKASLSDVGKTVSVWCKFTSTTDSNGKTTYTATDAVSTSVVGAGKAPVKTITGAIDNWSKLFNSDNKDEDNYVGDANTSVTVIANGTKNPTDMTVAEKTGVVTNAPSTTVNGDVVEFYADDEGNIESVRIYTYTVAKLSADPASKTDKDGNTTVDLKVAGLGAKIPVDQITGDWMSLKKDDVVLYYAKGSSNDALVTIEKAEIVSGKITNKNAKTNKITVNGTQYGKSGKTLAGLTAFDDLAPNKDNEYDFYLDKNGTVIGAKLVEGEVETKVAYVLDAAWVVPTASGLTQAGDAYIEAKILFTDATTEVVKVVKVGEDETKKIAEGNRDTTIAGIKGKLVDYSVDGSDYTVTAKVDAAKEEDGKVAPITAGAISVKPNFNGSLTANNSTVFLVEKVARDKDGAKDGDAEYTVYTGYKAVPAMTAVEGTTFAKDGFVTYAFISTTAFDGEGSDGLIYINDGEDFGVGTDENVRTYYNVVDAKGELLEEMQINVKDFTPATGAKFYVIKSTVDGVAVLKDTDKNAEALDSIGGGVAKVGSNTYSYDEASVCVLIDTTDDLTASGFDADNFSKEDGKTYTAVVLANGDGVIEYIYVVAATAPASAG